MVRVVLLYLLNMIGYGVMEQVFFEAGIGATFVSNELSNPLKVIRIGYRRMPPNGGFMFRAGICDLFLNSSSPKAIRSLNIISIMPAISIGYAFKTNNNQ